MSRTFETLIDRYPEEMGIYNNWEQFALFPCWKNSKRPATRHGFKDAKLGLNPIELKNRGYNVAMSCAMSNVIVLDIDHHNENANSLEELHALENVLGELPLTLTQNTVTNNGKHLIFSAKGIITPKGKISDNIDIKYNGYIMITPSVIDGKEYKIIGGIDEDFNFRIAELPQKWLDFINGVE